MKKTLLFVGEIGSPLAGTNLYRVEALRVGHWDYETLEGGLDVTTELLAELVEHFNDGSKGYEVPLNREHDDERCCGWVKTLELAPDGQSLWANFDVTDSETKGLVEDGSLKYCSSELDLAWFDPEDKATKRVFEGLALTNRPYIKRMAPVQPLNFSEFAAKSGDDPPGDPGQPTPKKETQTMDPEAQLREKEAEIASLKAQLAERSTGDPATVKLQEQLKEEQDARLQLEEKLGQTHRTMRLNSVIARLKDLTRKGKVTVPVYKKVVALTEALLGGASIDGTVVKLAAKRKLDEDEDPVDKLDVVDAMLDILQDVPTSISDEATLEEDDDKDSDDKYDQLDKVAAKMREKDPKLTYKEALKLAERQITGGAA